MGQKVVISYFQKIAEKSIRPSTKPVFCGFVYHDQLNTTSYPLFDSFMLTRTWLQSNCHSLKAINATN